MGLPARGRPGRLAVFLERAPAGALPVFAPADQLLRAADRRLSQRAPVREAGAAPGAPRAAQPLRPGGECALPGPRHDVLSREILPVFRGDAGRGLFLADCSGHGLVPDGALRGGGLRLPGHRGRPGAPGRDPPPLLSRGSTLGAGPGLPVPGVCLAGPHPDRRRQLLPGSDRLCLCAQPACPRRDLSGAAFSRAGPGLDGGGEPALRTDGGRPAQLPPRWIRALRALRVAHSAGGRLPPGGAIARRAESTEPISPGDLRPRGDLRAGTRALQLRALRLLHRVWHALSARGGELSQSPAA